MLCDVTYFAFSMSQAEIEGWRQNDTVIDELERVEETAGEIQRLVGACLRSSHIYQQLRFKVSGEIQPFPDDAMVLLMVPVISHCRFAGEISCVGARWESSSGTIHLFPGDRQSPLSCGKLYAICVFLSGGVRGDPSRIGILWGLFRGPVSRFHGRCSRSPRRR